MASANAGGGGTSFYAKGLGAEQVCSPFGGCVPGEAVDHVLVLLWAGVVALVVLVALQHIRAARAACEEERSRARAERDAFEAFARRLAGMEASSGAVREATAGGTALAGSTEDPRLERVRDAYRETVMSVPHYGDEYAEPVATNMTAEFGEEVATATLSGPRFTPGLKGALLGETANSRDQRDELLDALDREADALDRAAAALSDVGAALEDLNRRPLSDLSFDDLSAAYDRLGSLESEAESVLADRQRALHEDFDVGTRPSRSHAFHEYLYQSLPVTYPVLADATTLVDRIRRAKNSVALATTARA